ncbi:MULTISPECIES: carboxymuconolactone decarboxylase family protein [Chryseobacterium]|uniref:Carboxymuconolactone decarboxylase family protein n=1 Tax=Chryseobacterium indologenes TaxID=253 RepID=A0AAD0YZS0_CHRID|nr:MULTISPECIES: carboxymuconolactone decarboxylase family protein [Chryseobacterium]ASE60035.1 carboxymuconolactone decarboxylase family protein [Chryseobacterium indologenes]ATN04215.1 carboxymuconolactone decarboxylase family protein [Chryseobacterium indologenes]AYY83122.1 carboxymuconolactone decarboxylase family protein [Chryseobacterium indologenes]AZB19936.1 carboxymuconolactone decarboxylase family protein [Chryseobacterium indologenes]QIX80023.1 carboxymuconolactone decarboxylase fam
MSARLNIAAVESAAYKAMMGLEGYLQTTSLTHIQKELIKIRASQINKCAFCLDMHTKDAIKYGENPQRIFILNGWTEAKEFFTEEEQVLLAMTEEITLISHAGLTEETYQKAAAVFSEKQIAEIIMAIVTINAWNRIAVSTHMPIAK